jgi:hypothetical protein
MDEPVYWANMPPIRAMCPLEPEFINDLYWDFMMVSAWDYIETRNPIIYNPPSVIMLPEVGIARGFALAEECRKH